ncbi:MAG: M28 family peptidase [Pegethrix bostrychoides GSE-TBD4-15B]|jgi:Zn-dependent M28 family amino/carboxypeptidase|uniref:M28 family peptidase n=1 Tax=Pegethrix bostrychoides GSE-TBD4-15B TaxID=2839662 RepID=A0A951P9T0_9CYAN|nr:M28 family peptidase [Pegethrix bostrychoides GSE-TBD4-15B]
MNDLELRQTLEQHLAEVSRERDPYLASGGHFYVQQYIRSQFERWGTVEMHDFELRGKTHHNLILNLAGSDPNAAAPPVLIGAHYDAVPGCQGADDNATGVAALLALAEVVAPQPLTHPLRLVAFDLEEYGLLGSQAYAKLLRQQNQKLRLMISLEMLGYCSHQPNSQRYPAKLERFYPTTGNFIALVGNLATIPDLRRLSQSIRKSGQACEWLPAGLRGQMVPGTRSSDHAPFWDQGYAALMVTDTAYLRNPHYHLSSDRIETLDLDFFTSVCRGVIAGIRAL